MYYLRKPRLLALLLALVMLFSLTGTALASGLVSYPTYQEAYDRMVALQEKYPEGMEFTNSTPYDLNHSYDWHGGSIKGANGGVGCAAFAFELSDAAFGSLPCRVLDQGDFTFEDIKVGDILRITNAHFVIVLRKTVGGVIVAESNYNKTVHWGRAISASEVMNSSFIVTRYPKNFVPADAEDANKIIGEGDLDGLSWTLTNGGVLTISGDGAMPDFTATNRPSWEVHEDKIFTIVVENGITAIGDYAFSGLPVVSISMPSSVHSIGDDAFRQCTNLTSITIAEGITSIGERAFMNCTALTSVDLPSSLTSIGSGAFTSCEKLVQVRFLPSDGNLSIGDNLFTQCWNLHFASLPNGLTELTPGLFSSCKTIAYLYIPGTVTTLAEAGQDGPLLSSYVGVVYFGGTEVEWNAMMDSLKNTALLKATYDVLSMAEVYFDKEDPLVPDVSDSGGLIFTCKDDVHDWSDHNGICKACGLVCQHKMDTVTGICTICGWKQSSTPELPCVHVDEDGDGFCDKCAEAMPSNVHEENFASHSKTDFDDAGVCRHGGCGYTLIQFQKDCPADHAAIAVGSNCDVCGAAGTKADASEPIVPDQPDTPDKPDNPDTPIIPDQPDNPDEPSNPDVPDGSGTPSNPDSPGEQDTPDTPSVPSAPTEPSRPNRPSNPVVSVDTTPKPETIRQPDGSTITVTTQTDKSMVIKTGKSGITNVTIPVASANAGTVVMLVKPDSTMEVVRTSVVSAGNVVVPLPSYATIRIVDNRKEFVDVPSGVWCEDAVAFASAHELFSGTDDKTFSPEMPMTRAMLMTVLARLDGVDTSAGNTWYDSGVRWAKRNGISDGSSPTANITREQLVTMLWRYSGSPVSTGRIDRPDAGQINTYAVAAMRWALANGIINGYADGRLNPRSDVTRAEAAQFLQNFIEYSMLKDG